MDFSEWKDFGYSAKPVPVSFDPAWSKDKDMAAVKKAADDLAEVQKQDTEGLQIEAFAVHHGLTVKQAYNALKKSMYFEVKEQPKVEDHPKRYWPLVRKQAVDSNHALSPTGPCLICMDEAEKNTPPPSPEKVKVYLAYLNDTSVMGTKADLPEAKTVRRQISAFAAIHSFNRYTALEHIKKAGPMGEEFLLPYLFPLDKKSAVPDQYQLKTLEWADLAAVLFKAGSWDCGCYTCHSQKKNFHAWNQGKKTNLLEIPAIRALFPDKPVAGTGIQVDQIVKNNPVVTAGPKNAECLMTLDELKYQITIFSARHGINRSMTYSLLPDSWREKYVLEYSPKSDAVSLPVAIDEQGNNIVYGEIAAAIQCKCEYCKWAVSKTPMKWKKAQTIKKVTKKSLLAMETTLQKALGEGLSSEHDFSINAIPLEKQAMAFSAYHDINVYDVWSQKFPMDPNPFTGDEECDISDLDFHIWPSLVDLDDCECGECKGQPTPDGENAVVEAVKPAMKGQSIDMMIMDEVVNFGPLVDEALSPSTEKDMLNAIYQAELDAVGKKKWNLKGVASKIKWDSNKDW